jgi:hypothetical protein
MAKAPAFYRQSGTRPKVRASVTAPANGKVVINACVAPVTITNGIGERVRNDSRVVKITNTYNPSS